MGTGSFRRRAQLLHLRPDLSVVTIRGNVETRLEPGARRASSTPWSWPGRGCTGWAWTSTSRSGWRRRWFLPAVGQGALGIECRRDDADHR